MKLPKTKLIVTTIKGLCFYLLLVVVWGLLYYFGDAIKFSSATGYPNFWECVYFSCISFGTIGYGEIIPSGVTGQSFVFLQSMSSILFVSIFGGYITYLFLKRPDNIIITDNIHIRPLTTDTLFSVRIGNKGQALVDCRLDVDILQINNDIKKIIHNQVFKSALLEYSWRPALTLNKTENADFLNHFKTFYNNPTNSLIRITIRGSDIGTGEVVANYRYYQVKDVKISGDYLPLYTWKGFERTQPVWKNNNITQAVTQEGIDKVTALLKTC